MILSAQLISCDKEADEFDEFEDEDDDEPEKEPIAKRQMAAVRDTFKNVLTPSIKYLASGKMFKGMSSAIAGSRIGTTSSNAVNNFYKALRTQLTKQSSAATQAIIKQWQLLSKRLTNSRLAIGNLGAKLTNREESATKITKADEVNPTVLPKDDKTSSTVGSIKAPKPKEKKQQQQPLQSYAYQQGMQLQQLPAGFPVPVQPLMHPGYHAMPPAQATGPMDPMTGGYFAPPPVYAVPPATYSEW